MKTATSLTLVAAGAIISRSGWLRRTLVAKDRPGAAAAGASQRPLPPPRTAPGRQPSAAPDATQAEHQTIKEYAGA